MPKRLRLTRRFPVAMTEDGFWKEYNALKDSRDFQGAQEFYAEHKSVIGQ